MSKAATALTSVFPNRKSFQEFAASKENQTKLQTLVDFAWRNKVISRNRVDHLETFISNTTVPLDRETNQTDHSFAALLEDRNVLLDTRLSVRGLVNRVNLLLDEHHIGLPALSNSMLTRLKREAADTLHKRDVLRSLAFWIGYEKPERVVDWNFESLVSTCVIAHKATQFKEGVRIGFALQGRGDVIDHEIVEWMKREIKDYIRTAVSRFYYGKWGKVRSLDITTFYVDFPKQQTLSNPAAFRQCLSSAISLAHQLTVRWALSRFFSPRRSLAIGIITGEFSTFDKYLAPMLSARLPHDSVIRLTDYTRQCLLINDFRIRISPQAKEILLFDNEVMNNWWVQGFGIIIYDDFIPDLVKDPILQNDSASLAALNETLWFSERSGVSPAGEGRSNAVTIFLKNPQNAVLGIEIARILYYRRRYWEAIEILKVVLSINPDEVNARILRMVIFRDLAVIAPSLKAARGLFSQATEEADFVSETCRPLTEDFFCEQAVIYLAQAMTLLAAGRSGQLSEGSPGGTPNLFEQIMELLSRSESIFRKGLFLSPSGARSVYLSISVRLIKAILSHNPAILTNGTLPVDGPPELVWGVTSEFHHQIGYLRSDLPPHERAEFLEKAYLNDYLTYGNSVSLTAYRPTADFCGAVSRWDYMPRRTVGSAKKVIRILKEAREMSLSMMAQNICIYSFCRTFGEMISVSEFIEQIDQMIAKVSETAGEDLDRRDEMEELPQAGDCSDLILTLLL